VAVYKLPTALLALELALRAFTNATPKMPTIPKNPNLH